MRCLKPLLAVLSISLLSLAGNGQTQTEPLNLNFETDQKDQRVSVWRLNPVCSPTDSFTSTSENPFQGSFSGLIEMSGEKTLRDYCIIVQSFDATRFRGKRVRLRSAIRTEGNNKGRAQMWLRVDRKTEKGAALTGFFDNMDDRPVVSDRWGYYTIDGIVSSDAATLNIGFLLYGSGKTWVDDVSIEVTGDAKIVNEAPRPISSRGLLNIIAFTRLMGYVRHFHPSDQAAKTDWDRFAVEGIRQIEGAKNRKELAKKLNNIFKPVAPSVLVHLGSTPPMPSPPLSATKGLTWRHLSFKPGGSGIYKSERIEVERKAGDTPGDAFDYFTADLGEGLSATIPVIVYGESSGTNPNRDSQMTASSDSAELFSGNDRAVRLAAISLSWNIFQHFYPYFDVVKADWKSVLPKFLKMAAIDKDEEDFAKTLRRLVGQLQDGHGFIDNGDRNRYIPPVTLGIVDGKVLVTYIAEPIEGLNLGDAVLAVDGQPIERLLSEKGQEVSSATPQWKRFQVLSDLLGGVKDQIVQIEIERWRKPEEKSRISLKCDTRVDPNYGLSSINDKRHAKVAEIEPGIFYLNIDQLNDKDFNESLPKLAQANGIIFDFRGYPLRLGPENFLSRLTETTMKSASWLVPLVTEPDRRNMKFDGNREWEVKPAAPYLKAKKVFITDGRSISRTETMLGIIENYKLGEIVGETTAGTNGNINSFKLPGDYEVLFTGMKVLKHDGSRHHGVGIIPTVKVNRTRAGVAAGKDEFLEKALEIVKN
jgi:C-terminal processing protease CtpA/Prc